MATIRMEIEHLKSLVAKGRGDEKCHVVLIEEEQRKRIENSGPNPKTRFAVETDDPMLYAQLNDEKDRIIRRVKNKAIALDLMLRQWQELTDARIDHLLALEEGPN